MVKLSHFDWAALIGAVSTLERRAFAALLRDEVIYFVIGRFVQHTQRCANSYGLWVWFDVPT
jgi:hypothetical protein